VLRPPARVRAAAAIGGEFGGLGRRRVVVGEFVERLRNVLPGGSWWRLEDGDEAGGDGGGRAEGSGTTALSALNRMWSLVAADRWVIYAGFASLVGAAVMRASDGSAPAVDFLVCVVFLVSVDDERTDVLRLSL
jgi:ATP-binding cassette subfamily B (MDR/TAP) protein 9